MLLLLYVTDYPPTRGTGTDVRQNSEYAERLHHNKSGPVLTDIINKGKLGLFYNSNHCKHLRKNFAQFES